MLQGPENMVFEPLHIYTPTPEAVYGVAYIAVSPDHRLNQQHLYKVDAAFYVCTSSQC